MPKTILILRHAEEPADDESLDLSKRGRSRAEKLSAYIPKAFGNPGFLFAAAPSDSSVRCYLTLRPLADRLGLNIEGTYKEREFGALSSKLLADPAFDKSLVVVAWTHKQLPALASSLNVARGDFPMQWNENIFNLIFALTYTKTSRSPPKVKRTKQPF